MKKVKVRVAIKGDTEAGVLEPEQCKTYFDQGMFGEMEGVKIGSIEELKTELEVLEEKAGGELENPPEIIFMPMVKGG